MEKSEMSNKKENILVWLDFDAYSYVNFGAIIELAKLDKFDFIGIVTTKQDMSFFEHQKIIPFKKLIYYPDCYIKKSDYNITKLKEIETKYELNLWLDVFTERSFYRYWTKFHKFSKEEIFTIVEKSILFFIDILEKYKPKIILTQYIGENISNLLLYKIGGKMNIKTIMPIPMFIHNKIILSNNIIGSEIIDEYKKIIENFEDTSNEYTENYIKKENFSQTLKIQSTYNPNILNLTQKINYYKKRIFTNPEPIYKNKGKSEIKLIKNKFQQYFEIRKREKFLNLNSIKNIEDDNFILFPMQSMPEAKVLTISPFYSNQITIIENIAKAIPINTILYVKEHPIQKTKLWRSVEFYKKIIAIPNVKLVHPSVNSQELIAKTKAVILISGGTGFEALFHKKPVILFSDEIYEELSTVTKFSTFDNLHEDISKAIKNFKFNVKEINALMTVIENQSISIPYFTMIKEGVTLSAIQRNKKNPELTLQHFQKFYEKYEEYFKEYAKAVYSKF
jgi:hypothetical protein